MPLVQLLIGDHPPQLVEFEKAMNRLHEYALVCWDRDVMEGPSRWEDATVSLFVPGNRWFFPDGRVQPVVGCFYVGIMTDNGGGPDFQRWHLILDPDGPQWYETAGHQGLKGRGLS